MSRALKIYFSCISPEHSYGWTYSRNKSLKFQRFSCFTGKISKFEICISLTFCTRTRSFARANDANIVRRRNAQCKTKESPLGRVRLGSIRRNKNGWNNASKRLFGSYSHSGIPGFPFRLFCSQEQNSWSIFRNIFLFRISQTNVPWVRLDKHVAYGKTTMYIEILGYV